jgi:hypothetical protein
MLWPGLPAKVRWTIKTRGHIQC